MGVIVLKLRDIIIENKLLVENKETCFSDDEDESCKKVPLSLKFENVRISTH